MSGILCATGMGLGLTATASGSVFYGGRTGTGSVTSAACTVTPASGVAPYTYSWTYTSGDATTTISNASAAVVTWSRTFGLVTIVDSLWSCVVTDTAGATATITGIDARLERIS